MTQSDRLLEGSRGCKGLETQPRSQPGRSALPARCRGQGSPSFPLPTLLHVHCLGKLITLMGKDILEELAMPSPDNSARPQGRGELLRRWERGYMCQLKLNGMLVVAWRIFFPTSSKETQSLKAVIS